MIKIKSAEQARSLSIVLDTESGSEGGVQIGQANDGVIGVSRMSKSQKIETHTYIMENGDTREVGFNASET